MNTNHEVFNVVKVDFNNQQQCEHLAAMLIAYSADPMGGGKALPEATAQKSIELLRQKDYAHSFLCYEKLSPEKEIPVGFSNCFENIATFAAAHAMNIHDVSVIESHRGKGIATLLLNAIENFCKANNYYKITLEVLDGNAPAKHTYKKFGFDDYQLDPEVGHARFWQKVI